MFAAGKHYRSLIDDDGECNNSLSVMKCRVANPHAYGVILMH